jgi:uncharacterized protein (DUF2164 family)
MDNDFLKRILLERDYKISLLHENLELGNIDGDILFQYLNEITTLQYRYFGHFDVINIPASSTIEEKLKSLTQSFFVLEKSISFADGIVAALSSDSTNRHLLSAYHSKKNNDISIRDRIIVSGQNEILESYGFQLSDL